MWRDEQPLDLSREVHFDGRVVWCFRDRPGSVHEMFSKTVARHGAQDALCGEEGRISYDELCARTARIAGGLFASGIGKGDRVALLIGNRFAYVEALLACQRIGAVTVPMNPLQRAPEIAYALNQCGAIGLIYEAELECSLPDPAETPLLKQSWAACGPAGAPSFEALVDAAPIAPVPVAEEDTAVILYTSGTTGKPKGAMLTHLGIVHSALHFMHSMDIQPSDRNLLAVPASHVTGLIANVAASLVAGAAVVFLRAFKAGPALELIEAERVTHTLIVPAMYNLFLMEPEFDRHDLSRWRIGGFGGAPMPEATIGELARRAPQLALMNGYGATEATSPSTMLPSRFAASRPDSVGLPLHCVELCAMDDEGREVPPGESGEIWMRGPHIVPGYWDNADANANNFVGGFWKSGDIGAIDSQGFVRVFDRMKDMVNRGGYKIYSIEVENVLAYHPNVMESAVIGRPCPVLGERADAVVVPKGAAPGDGLADSIRRFAAARLSEYKVPERILFQEMPLPRNANGKVVKTILREAYA